ncbi:glycosyltransferase family 39 protein [Flavobacteriaceae sp. LMIT009]
MKTLLKSKYRLLTVCIATLIVCCIGLGSWGVTETSESRYSQIAKEMHLSGDYVNPTLLDVYHYHKPPVTYAIASAGYRLFGINEFGARFFLQIALVLQIFLVYRIALLLVSDKKIAFTSALIYLSLPLVLISVRNLTTDAFLNTFVLGSIFSWLYYLKHRKAIFIYIFYICLGLIINIKGPIGLLFPLIFMASYLIVFKHRVKLNLHHLLGFILLVLLSASWVYALSESNPKILDYFLNEQIADRITSGSFNRGKPFWYYLVVLPLTILPWLWPTVKGLKGSFIKGQQKVLLLVAVNILTILLFFSVASTKLILYILPIGTFIALLCGIVITSVSEKHLKFQKSIILIFSGIILLALFLLPVIDSKYNVDYTYLVLISLVFLVGLFTISKVKIEQRSKLLAAAFLLMLSTVWGSVVFFNGNEIQVNSIKPIIDHIDANDELKSKNIVVYNYLLPSASYYTNKPIVTINNGHNTVKRDLRFQNDDSWKKYLIDAKTEEGIKQLDSLASENVILFTRRKHQLPENLEFFQKDLNNKVDFDKWIIYY